MKNVLHNCLVHFSRHGYELRSLFPLQTLIMIVYEQDTPGMMIMMILVDMGKILTIKPIQFTTNNIRFISKNMNLAIMRPKVVKPIKPKQLEKRNK